MRLLRATGISIALSLAACGNVTTIGGGGGGASSGATSASDGPTTGTGSTGATSSSGSTTGSGGGVVGLTHSDKVDLLFMIDNSRSMADKQEMMALQVADLVQALVNPACIDGNGNPVNPQPVAAQDPCPGGSTREFPPVVDIHIGMVTSSLGSHGADTCPDQPNDVADCPGGATNTTANDHGHLVTRKNPCLADQVPTYQSLGFLAWDPEQKQAPPGEQNAGNLSQSMADLVVGAGQIGCGYESQLESWYRFLVDPAPYATIDVDKTANAVKSGLDSALLKQRADFLRPDSVLAIVMLTDENDCSAVEGGQYYLLEQVDNGQYHLPPARSECKTNPNDPCCKSCAQSAGACPMDPSCTPALSPTLDSVNLRCFKNKQRFGIDFLYPTSRYAQALSSATLTDADSPGDSHPNPIFGNAQDPAAQIRGSGLVFLTAITGVPWQDVARDAKDLGKGFKSGAELVSTQAWPMILGDIYNYVDPTDPFMKEQIDPRSGTNPITGDAIEPPGSASKNAINGSEWNISQRDDLQYACSFPLIQPRDCSKGDPSCNCAPMDADDETNPLCAPNPKDMMNFTLQVGAKAYPGLRQLDVVRQLGDQGVVASICPAQVTDASKVDFGYRPAIRSLVERLRPALQ